MAKIFPIYRKKKSKWLHGYCPRNIFLIVHGFMGWLLFHNNQSVPYMSLAWRTPLVYATGQCIAANVSSFNTIFCTCNGVTNLPLIIFVQYLINYRDELYCKQLWFVVVIFLCITFFISMANKINTFFLILIRIMCRFWHDWA